MCEDVAAKGAVLLLVFECLFVGGFLLLSECVDRLDGVSEFLSDSDLFVCRFARIRVTDFACVLSAVSFCEINIAVAAQFATQSGD